MVFRFRTAHEIYLTILLGPRPSHIPVGSVQIDNAFRELVEKRLRHIPRKDGIPHIPNDALNKMTKDFQYFKERFGTNEVNYLKEFKVAVPVLPKDFNNENAKIKDGRMIFSM
jgi:hypothetical protein